MPALALRRLVTLYGEASAVVSWPAYFSMVALLTIASLLLALPAAGVGAAAVVLLGWIPLFVLATQPVLFAIALLTRAAVRGRWARLVASVGVGTTWNLVFGGVIIALLMRDRGADLVGLFAWAFGAGTVAGLLGWRLVRPTEPVIGGRLHMLPVTLLAVAVVAFTLSVAGGLGSGPLAECRAVAPTTLPSGQPSGEPALDVSSYLTATWGSGDDRVTQLVDAFLYSDEDRLLSEVNIRGRLGLVYEDPAGRILFSWSDDGCDFTVFLARSVQANDVIEFAKHYYCARDESFPRLVQPRGVLD